tara:strand:- start:421 stop:642 length:222 start_codon:yes stop_codon:yes gene_type:complete
MADTQEITITSDWNANDYSNIITISSAAIASVLLVIFKSKCSDISVCCGLFKCVRKVELEVEDAPDPGPIDNP